MKFRIALLLGLIAIAGPGRARPDRQPRIWLTPAVLASLQAKARTGDRDWLDLKAEADRLLTRRMPRFTITDATTSNPVRFTLAETIPWSDTTDVFIAGATGAWAAVNVAGDRPRPIAATRTGRHTFTIPIDSTALGSFAGQRIVLFVSEGGHSEYGYNGGGWQSTLETLGLVYQVTGDPAYAAKGIELVDYIASLGAAGMHAPASLDSGFPSRSAVYGLAIGYDWLHDRMSAAQRAAVAKTLNLWFDWFKHSAFQNTGPAYGNYFGGHVLGFGLAGLATGPENPRGAEIAIHIRRQFEAHVPPAFTTGGFAGGYPVESYPYGANHFQRLLMYMLAVESATGVHLESKRAYASAIARNLLYNVKPNGWQVTDEGTSAGSYTGVLPPSLPVLLSSVLAGTAEGKWMQHLSRTLDDGPRVDGEDAFVRFLFGDPARPADDYRLSLPAWFHSPGDEHFYRRSSWERDAVWTSIAAGSTHWAGHQLRGAGHVAIQRGDDYLLVNSGQWKGASGAGGVPQASDLRSWRANTLFVDDFGDYLFTGADYLGGQGFWGRSRVMARDGGAEFGYMKSDLTTAYSVGNARPWADRSVRDFHRSFLSMGNGVVLVFDRALFRQPHYVRKLYFHVNPSGGPPAIAGNTATVRAGHSVLFIRTLLPAAPVLAAAADPVSASDHRPITYRLEVSDSTANHTFTALNVLIAAASSTTSMPPTLGLRSTGGTMVGAMVKDGSVHRIGLFAADGAPQANVSYTAQYQPGEGGVHVIVDLVPEAEYVITRDGVRIGEGPASSGGVVTFRSSQGGLFTISNRAGAAHRPGSRRRPPV